MSDFIRYSVLSALLVVAVVSLIGVYAYSYYSDLVALKCLRDVPWPKVWKTKSHSELMDALEQCGPYLDVVWTYDYGDSRIAKVRECYRLALATGGSRELQKLSKTLRRYGVKLD